MEKRMLEGHVELRGEDDDKRIGGVAAVYYDGTPQTEFRLWAGAVERILPGAFDRAIKEDDVRALFNHDQSLVLGRNRAGTLKLTSTNEGLDYEITPADTTIYRDVTQHLARGDVTGSSFAFSVTTGGEEWSEDEERGLKVREVRDAKLFDVSPVTYPAYQATEASLRSDAQASYDNYQKALDQRQRDNDRQKQAEVCYDNAWSE